MNHRDIRLERRDGVCIVTLDRPQAGNALTIECAQALLDVALSCEADPQCRAVVLTGSGPMFCVGADLKTLGDLGERAPAYVSRLALLLHECIARLNRIDAPVISAINGTAAGGGFSLAIATDIAIAAASARFTMAYTKAGLSPDLGSSYFLARIVGMRRAKELALLNTVLSAEQALHWGLVNQVHDDAALMDAALAIANRLADGPTRAFGETKRLMLAGATESLESQMAAESRIVSAMAGSAEGREGIAAFQAKRKPSFRRA